jgi:hypothetical protein
MSSHTGIRFHVGQRIRVKGADLYDALAGKTGTVVRMLRRSSEEAWVEMDDHLPDDLRSFPEFDQRAKHILLYDNECEEIV